MKESFWTIVMGPSQWSSTRTRELWELYKHWAHTREIKDETSLSHEQQPEIVSKQKVTPAVLDLMWRMLKLQEREKIRLYEH